MYLGLGFSIRVLISVYILLLCKGLRDVIGKYKEQRMWVRFYTINTTEHFLNDSRINEFYPRVPRVSQTFNSHAERHPDSGQTFVYHP